MLVKLSALIFAQAMGLQFVLNYNEPYCLDFVPKSYTQGMTVSYTSTGMNEDQV